MKNSTLNRVIPWLFGPVYILGILATFVDPNSLYERVVAEPLRQVWFPLYPFVAIPLYGLFGAVPAFIGAFCFNVGTRFSTVRITVSSLLFFTMYFLGNSIHFHKGQWAWLHLFMLAQLATSGIMIRKIQVFNWLMFGFWILAIDGRRLRLLVLFDYAVAIYFLFVAVASWSFPVKNAWALEEG
jgi:hypothetical protein